LTKYLLILFSILISTTNCRNNNLSDINFAKRKNKPNEICLYLDGKQYPVIINSIGKKGNKLGFNASKVWNRKLHAEISNFFIGPIDLKLGKQTIYKSNFDSTFYSKLSSTFYTMTSDGDVVGDTYSILESDSANNYFNITKQKKGFSRIEGSFSLTFVRTNKSVYTQFPDLETVKFRNCTFYFYL
jgi:hypothetical protein